jgi:hypothetical protein
MGKLLTAEIAEEKHAKIAKTNKAMTSSAFSRLFSATFAVKGFLAIQTSHGEAFDGMRP